MNVELIAARERHELAWIAFNKAREAYRAMQIDDATFLAARAAYDISGAAYDAAIEAAAKIRPIVSLNSHPSSEG